MNKTERENAEIKHLTHVQRNQIAIDAIVKAWNDSNYEIAETVMDVVHAALTNAGYKLD